MHDQAHRRLAARERENNDDFGAFLFVIKSWLLSQPEGDLFSCKKSNPNLCSPSVPSTGSGSVFSVWCLRSSRHDKLHSRRIARPNCRTCTHGTRLRWKATGEIRVGIADCRPAPPAQTAELRPITSFMDLGRMPLTTWYTRHLPVSTSAHKHLQSKDAICAALLLRGACGVDHSSHLPSESIGSRFSRKLGEPT